ncbi:MAG: helix-turn-helix domain-containing protein [Dehalococcoidia bacterium]|nr:helix-turn-helix domain-containing protein [Dehalococcoidia bacterium]
MSELGSRLIRAREARGLTLEDAERDTRISRRYLQALESEQLEVIPAPVYARGFLRSYSQYLGLDPQETLALFPREDDAGYSPPPAPSRPSPREPISAVGPARPTWRRSPRTEQPGQPRQDQPPPPAPSPERRPLPPAPSAAHEDGWEPMIGVDIGVPAPARRLKTDPAAQTRSMTVLVIAVGAVIAVVVLAFLISRLGGGDDAGGATPPTGTSSPAGARTSTADVSSAAATSGLQTTRGVVPDVKGQTAATARLAIQEAGFSAREQHAPSSTVPKGSVADQAPAGGLEQPEGSNVIIVVSDGP